MHHHIKSFRRPCGAADRRSCHPTNQPPVAPAYRRPCRQLPQPSSTAGSSSQAYPCVCVCDCVCVCVCVCVRARARACARTRARACVWARAGACVASACGEREQASPCLPAWRCPVAACSCIQRAQRQRRTMRLPRTYASRRR